MSNLAKHLVDELTATIRADGVGESVLPKDQQECCCNVLCRLRLDRSSDAVPGCGVHHNQCEVKASWRSRHGAEEIDCYTKTVYLASNRLPPIISSPGFSL